MNGKFENQENFIPAIKNYTKKWEVIFKLTAGKVDMKKPLTKQILMNPNHPFVKTLIYIYSMQSFVFGEMNKASREKDFTKVRYYGPLAAALGLVIHYGNNRSSKLLKK